MASEMDEIRPKLYSGIKQGMEDAGYRPNPTDLTVIVNRLEQTLLASDAEDEDEPTTPAASAAPKPASVASPAQSAAKIEVPAPAPALVTSATQPPIAAQGQPQTAADFAAEAAKVAK